MMARMQDVARIADVSLMTVSNVVNERGKMSAATRQRVLDAMQELDYRVNQAARSLRTGRTGVIGLAVPDLQSSYLSQLTSRIVTVAEERGMRVAIEVTGASPTEEIAAVAHSRKLMYDGLILSVAGLTPHDVRLFHADYPLVIIGEGIPEAEVDRVAMPNESGGRLAAEHLVERGCRRVALVVQQQTASTFSSLRSRGFRDALAAAGIAPPVVIEPSSYSLEGGVDAARQFVERGLEVEGVFLATDSTALGFLRGLADHGIRVPDDLLVVGFDDIDESRYAIPSLTTINPDHDFVATSTVDLLLQRIDQSDDPPEPREIMHEPLLVVRESSSPRSPSV